MSAVDRRRLLLPLIGLLVACRAEPAEPAPAAPAAEAPREEVVYGATPLDNLQVVQVELDAPNLASGLDGVRLAVVSDLQLGLWSGTRAVVEAALRRAAELDAEAVVLLGDYLGRGESTGELAVVLAALRGRPAFAVLGERDVRSDSVRARVVRALREAGVQVLVNERAALARGGDTLYLAGIDPELIGRSGGEQDWILSTLAGPNAVLLSHLPGIAGRLREQRFAGVLAGNTVCGEVEVPGAARLVWVDSTLLAHAVTPVPRLYRVGRTTLFVTCGVGYGFMPARMGGVPEVALVTLRRVGPAAAPPAARDTVTEGILEGALDPGPPPGEAPPEP